MDCCIIEWKSVMVENFVGKVIGEFCFIGKVVVIVYNLDIGVNEEKDWSSVYLDE